MKFLGCIVLPHHPGSSFANLGSRAVGKSKHLRIELLCTRIAVFNSGFELGQRVLNMPRIFFVGKVFRNVFVRQRSAKPGCVPRQERNNDEESRDYY